MIVNIDLPIGTDIQLIREYYPEFELHDQTDEDDQYYIGSTEPLESGEEWLTLEEAEECYGFILGVVPSAHFWFEGFGGWGMGEEQKTPQFKKGFQKASKLLANMGKYQHEH